MGNLDIFQFGQEIERPELINLRKQIKCHYIIFDFRVPQEYPPHIFHYNIVPHFNYFGNGMMINHNFYNNSYSNQQQFYNNNNFNNFQHQNYVPYNQMPFNQYQPNNNNINNINNFQKEETLEMSNHLRGLVNIANTCYMNSTIQCFAHIKELFSYFNKPKIIELMSAPANKDKLSPVFSSLIIALWFPYDSSPLYPYIFKERLGKMNQLFAGPIPNDAKDLLTFLLMQIHDE